MCLDCRLLLFFYQKSCQTGEISTAEAAVQSHSSRDAGIQTDQSQEAVQDLNLCHRAPVDYAGLLSFLQRVEEDVIKELNKNWRSHAFDGFEVNWTDQNETVRWQISEQCDHP